MAAIDFPASPTTGQLFSVAGTGVTYQYNGTLWLVTAGPGGSTGDFMVRGVPTLGAGATVLVLSTIVTGNSGSWYNVANGQYKPPAGRYYISCGCSASLSGAGDFSMDIGIRKNFVMTASRTYNNRTTAFSFGGVVTDGVYDANGTTDQFDFLVTTNVAASTVNSAWICAFPISGMQGPQGPPGVAGGGASLTVSDTAPGSPTAGAMWWNSILGTLYLYYNDGNSSQWVPASPIPQPPSGTPYLSSETVLAAPATTMSVTFPVGAKRAEIDIWHTTSPFADLSGLVLQGMTGASVVATAAYNNMADFFRSDGSSTGSFTSTQTAFTFNGNWAQMHGRIDFQRPDAGYGVAHLHGVTAGGSRYQLINAMEGAFAAGTFTGYRLSTGGGNFATGSFMRCYVVV